MDWQQLLVSITRSVDEELRLRNAYLVTENRILRQPMTERVPLSDGDRLALAKISQKLGRKALAEIATIAKPDTILAWHRTLGPQPLHGTPLRMSIGRPRIDKELETLIVRMRLILSQALAGHPDGQKSVQAVKQYARRQMILCRAGVLGTPVAASPYSEERQSRIQLRAQVACLSTASHRQSRDGPRRRQPWRDGLWHNDACEAACVGGGSL